MKKEIKRTGSTVFIGKLLEVHLDEVRLPDGRTAEREYIIHQGAVVMIPVLPDGELVFVQQYRYAQSQFMIELPAGKIDPGEDFMTTADRELREEIGYRSKKLTLLGELDPCVGYSNEHMGIVLAENLVPDSIDGDDDEWLEILTAEFDEALDWVWSGKITDAKTLASLLWYTKIKERV